jgi:hypothetical protein
MDNSHVALVNVMLREDAFQNYRCDRNMPLGINVRSTNLPFPTLLLRLELFTPKSSERALVS